MNNTTHNIIEKITGKIRSGEVSMHSRALFVLRALGLILLSVFVFLTSALIVNFILFSIHMSSTNELLGFGPRGWGAFFRFFPWGLLVVDVVSVVLLVLLLRTFRFGYRMPLLYVFGAFLFFAIVAGATIERYTPMNAFLDREVRGPGMHRGMGGMWNRMHTAPQPGEGVCRCEIISIKDSTHLTVKDIFTGEIFHAVVGNTPHATTTGLEVGNRVFLAGDVEGDTFTIFGLKRGGEGRRWGGDE